MAAVGPPPLMGSVMCNEQGLVTNDDDQPLSCCHFAIQVR